MCRPAQDGICWQTRGEKAEKQLLDLLFDFFI